MTRSKGGIRAYFLLALPMALLSAGLAAGMSEESRDAGKRPLNHDDYDSWLRIRDEQISPDGNWILYKAVPGQGDAEMVVKSLDGTKDYRQPAGHQEQRRRRRRFPGQAAATSRNLAFSGDSRYAVFLINPSWEETKAAKKKKGKESKDGPYKSLGILRLSDGHFESVERVRNFKLPEEAGGWLAYLKEKEKEKKKEGKEEEKPAAEGEKQGEAEESAKEPDPDKKKKDKKKYGTQMVLRSLDEGEETAFESVTEYRFTKQADGLFYIVSSKDKPESDGVYALTPGKGESRALISGKGNYQRWAIDEEETRLAFLSDRDSTDSDTPVFKLYGWDVGSEQAQLWVSHDQTEGFPEGLSVSDKSAVSFSDDGKTVLFGIKEIAEAEPEEEDEEDSEEKAKFDLWHWKDPYPQPQQLELAKRYQDQTFESVYHLESGRFVQLADADVPDVRLSDNGRTAYANNNLPYRQLISYDGSYNDVYSIDPTTGERRLAARKIRASAQISPGGGYLSWFGADGHWHLHDIGAGQTRNLTEGMDVSFARQDWDTPSPARPYGAAGWTDEDASQLLYDEYDIWEFDPQGVRPPRMITEGRGREQKISFRYLRLDPDEDFIDPQAPLLLQAVHQESMASGFYRDRVQGTDEPVRLLMADKGFGRPRKARQADRLLFSRASFDEYPDLWTAPADFDAPPRQLTNLGSQTDPFLWGKAELRDFDSADGKPLKGILIKPDNYDPSKRYPLMVYIYETLHQGLHRFIHPGPGTSINHSYYSSNGYLLWMPDIEYDTGNPGQDSLKCVLPGIQMLIREGLADRQAIGIQGHSWGGYQIAYMVTKTNIFAAAEAGAPVSNMTSAYGGIRWGSGMVRQFQYERTQSRLGASLWEVPLRYLENSPVFWADKVQTPLLILHNDKDGAVPWYQGIELIMALRRLGREAYMFNYNGEEHGLRQRVNQKDWTRRMSQFFDHHLKGAAAPEWMEEGILGWEKGKTDK
ncbi:MAG: prolyl oligopeptidase family serine peptidase [Acidobacteriota bacterium]